MQLRSTYRHQSLREYPRLPMVDSWEFAKSDKFTPLALSPYLWIDASQLTGLADGQQIPSFFELASNHFAVSQINATQQPIYSTNVQNGLPAITFDGIDDFLEVSGLRLPNSNISIFIVGSTNLIDTWHTALAQDNRRLFCGVSGGFDSDAGSFVEFYESSGGTSGYTAILTASAAFQVSVTEASASNTIHAWLNGTAGFNQSGLFPIDTATAPMIVGAYGNTSQFFWDGWLGEIIVCPAVSSAVRSKVESYLKAKWATP